MRFFNPENALWALALAAALLVLPRAGSSQVAIAAQAQSGGNAAELVVPIFKSRILDVPRPVSRISVGNPDIADILVLKSNRLYVLGKDLGTTNVLLWDRFDDLVATISVSVVHDLDDLKARLNDVLPEEPVRVYSAQRSIVLAGKVSSVTAMESAVSMARGYLQQVASATDQTEFEGGIEQRGDIINLLTVGGAQQVMLEVKVAEIERTLLRRLHAQFNAVKQSTNWRIGGLNGGATFPDATFVPGDVRVPVFGGSDDGRILGPVIDEFMPNVHSVPDAGLFSSFLTDNTLVNLALDAAKQNQLAKILAEPTLTTLTGQEAEFVSGGEFPIPVPRGDSGISIVFKEFGVILKFLPVVLAQDRINLKVNIEVSELVESAPVLLNPLESPNVFFIPRLRKRGASSTVELSDGQTMGIAGLVNEQLREQVTKFPGLGDLPILGQLFRSQDFLSGETELVILVTPRLAKPIAPEDIRLPTDGLDEPDDWEYYLLGQSTRQRPRPIALPTTSGGTEGDYGHTVD